MGLSYIISQEMITLPLREWVNNHLPQFFSNLINCPTCTAFWCALLLGFFFTTLFPLIDAIICVAVVRVIEKITIALS
jgi:hypothetical protein